MVTRSHSDRVKFLLLTVVITLQIVMIITTCIIVVIVIVEDILHASVLSGVIRTIRNVTACVIFYFQTVFHVCCVCVCVCVRACGLSPCQIAVA